MASTAPQNQPLAHLLLEVGDTTPTPPVPLLTVYTWFLAILSSHDAF